jgi:threonylcarbamoyladenosine tRNA methylthiotransferase MtaB
MRRVAFYSQGCRLNHAEIATLTQQFSTAGYRCVPFGQAADIVVINTCTVTENGDRDTRRLVNRIARQSTDIAIALIGCQSQILKDRLVDFQRFGGSLGMLIKCGWCQLSTSPF